MNTELAYRPGNRSLALLIRSYPARSTELDLLIKWLPQIAFDLYGQAQDSAKDLLEDHMVEDAFATDTVPASVPNALLGQCIFDLMLLTYFNEVVEFCKDNNATSLLVDSLLYQATGCEPSIPTDEDLLNDGTQNARGIHKFLLASKRTPNIPDYVAWTFGKEFAAISCGSAMDMAGIISASNFSLLVRAHTKQKLLKLFHGGQQKQAERRCSGVSLPVPASKNIHDCICHINERLLHCGQRKIARAEANDVIRMIETILNKALGDVRILCNQITRFAEDHPTARPSEILQLIIDEWEDDLRR